MMPSPRRVTCAPRVRRTNPFARLFEEPLVCRAIARAYGNGGRLVRELVDCVGRDAFG